MVDWKKLVPLFILLLTIGYFAIASWVILSGGDPDFASIIAGNTSTDLLFLFIGIPLLICIPAIFLKNITLLNYKFTKYFQKKDYEYRYVDLGERPFTTLNMIIRTLLPVFMSLAISLLIVDLFLLEKPIKLEKVTLIIILSLIIAPIVSFLVVPIWAYKDSGIVKLRKKPKKRFPPELIFYGKIQHQYYKGFTGITTPILYIITIISEVQISLNLTILLIFLFPFFLIGFFMPLLLIYEARIKKVNRKLVKSLSLTLISLEKIKISPE